jgi:outer membrane protein assembly factor BamB
MPRLVSLVLVSLIVLGLSCTSLQASDWLRFRGPNGSGVTADAASPIEWSDDKNIAWKIDLPGPGSSCPIVVGDKVILTCWTGYGLSREEPGDQANLKRMVLCYDRETGKELWTAEDPAKLPEDKYEGMFAEHGYASHTPTSDGERVYVYFGRSGALAYDMDGKELWQTDCGDGFGASDWGSAASPVVVDDVLVCSATAESSALIGLDKKTGKELWRYGEEGWNGCWGTPIVVEANGRKELVYSAPEKLIALDPATGKLLWHCTGSETNSITASVVAHDGVVYFIGNRGASLAVKAGGEGDVTDTNIVWRENLQGSIPSPIYHDGRIYGVGRGGMLCFDAATGERVYQARLNVPGAPAEPPVAQAAAAQAPAAQPAVTLTAATETLAQNTGDNAGGPGRGEGDRRRGEGDRGRGGRGGRGGGGGGFRNQSYASPVIAGDHLYQIGRQGDGHVVKLGDEFNEVATNVLTDGGDFSATPAIVDGTMYLRSSKHLYCIRATGEGVAAR